MLMEKMRLSHLKKYSQAKRPDVEFVAEQWPALLKINAGSEIQSLANSKPDAIYNVTFGGDLAKFVREGNLRGFFKNVFVVSLLTGEPEYLDPLKMRRRKDGWSPVIPGMTLKLRLHDKFLAAYQKKFNTHPRTGSVVGYNVMMTVAHLLKNPVQPTPTK